jgi:peptide/nickel transport system permease protein
MRTIGAQLTEPMRLHLGLRERDARAAAVELLERVVVSDAAHRMRDYPFQLSGGLAQRVCIALALSCRPTVLLADEPTSSLDTTVAAEVLDLLEELKRSMGLAVLLVSHSLDLVASRADDVLVLHAGRIAERSPVAALFARPQMPYTQALLAAMPRLANPSHTRLSTLPMGLGTLALLAPGCAFAPRCQRADDRCRADVPPLVSGADGAAVACWHPG